MTSSGPGRFRRTSVLTNEWPPRQTAYVNCGKNSMNRDSLSNTPADYCWHDDEQARRYEWTKPSGRRQGEATCDHQLYKVDEDKSSAEDSLTEAEVNDNGHGDVPAPCRRYETAPREGDKPLMEYPSYGEIADQSNVAAQSQRNFRDYAKSVNLRQALKAMRKLECLKELQRRRDLAERFYSQEIRRLIGEHFFNGSSTADPNKAREKGTRLPLRRSRG